jgi:hypothetical protein
MKLDLRIKQAAWVGLVVIAIGAASLTILHLREEHNVAAAPVVAKTDPQPASQIVPPPVQPNVQPSQPPPSQPWTNASDDPTVFTFLAESEVSRLRAGITLAEWREARGSEQWESARPEMLVDGPGLECLSLRKADSLPSGAKVVRVLYFYPPRVPSPIVFPSVNTSSPFDSCTLAIVRLEAEASFSETGRGHAMAQAIAQRFAQIYGISNDPEEVRRRSVKFWGEDGGHWIANIDITSSYDTKPGLDPEAPGQLIQGPVVRVSAELPRPRELDNSGPLISVDRSAEAAQFRRAVALSQVDSSLSHRITKLYDLDVALADQLNQKAEEICKTHCVPEAMPKPTGNDWREPLVPVLQDWFQALKTAETGRRAAGLLAADRLLLAFQSVRPGDQFGGEQQSTAEQTKLRSALRDLGATFAPDFADPYYHYTGNWLDQAKDLDLESEGGRLALVTWMSHGPACDQAGGDDFRKIISEGEKLLAKNIDPPTAARVHFMVGDAYSDIVAIAGGKSGANGEYDPSQYAGEADADRTKALAHYRAGLAVDNTSDDAKDAWRQAWHLSAGLVPGERYVCFGD